MIVARGYLALPTNGTCDDCGWKAQPGGDDHVTNGALDHLQDTGHKVRVITTACVIFEPALSEAAS